MPAEIAKKDFRDAFFDALYDLALRDERIVLLSDDFGAPSLDKYRSDIKSRYFNIGIAEQNMIGLAAGLALSGKIVFAYAIAPFITLRCFEQVKIDLCLMNLHVNLIGVGAGFSYGTAGPTHHAVEDISVMRTLPNISIYCPADAMSAAALARVSLEESGPKYLRFDRGITPSVYTQRDHFSASEGFGTLSRGDSLCILATGKITGTALSVANRLRELHNVHASVIDVNRLKPFNVDRFLSVARTAKGIVTLEEHILAGGLGSIVAEIMCDHAVYKPLWRFGVTEKAAHLYENVIDSQRIFGLDTDSLVQRIAANMAKDLP